ncbi:unnamed protein product [Darwinula stevensoni]|uniref:cellulase n=1 Tax=Darwinula stevensoni TaxID=69355 RepID=A0A7R9FR51_9CRUS|nr:unnamed protein product [Darwinula stevensoni]CAG0900645.1 unnamed protein product [Darwinula stevensoni]
MLPVDVVEVKPSPVKIRNHGPSMTNWPFGFAAATIPGLSEQDRCCACYKLDFTSGPVQGKTMIVQVTNSGGDVNALESSMDASHSGIHHLIEEAIDVVVFLLFKHVMLFLNKFEMDANLDLIS